MITVGFSTRQEDNSKYVNYIRETCMYKNIEVIAKVNKGDKSLSQVYNEIIDESTNDIVVLIHDDLEFDTKNWGDKLLKVFKKNPEYSILGLAGTKYLDSNAKWWTVPSTMYGIVNHKHEGKKWTSTYSPDLNQKVEETIIVDGLFIAFDKTKIKHKFDEEIPGFHFYDLGFCLPNYLSGVKIGVTSFVRVTHLSIGQTNQQWEDNRISFSEKYNKNLPIDILNKNMSETFIFCHDQDIILSFEENEKFKNLYKYTYVFLGSRETDKLTKLNNLIIARDLPFNIEQFPDFNTFTGWYALWKNNLIKTEYINLFEYDIILDPYIDQHHLRIYENGAEIVGYVPVSMSNYHFINNRDWVEHIGESISQKYNFNIYSHFQKIVKKEPKSIWSSTSNTTFKTYIFNEYMKWFEPLFESIKNTKYCGHAHERSITFFTHHKKKKQFITNGLLKHFQLDSHRTQGHQVNMELSLQKISTNNL